MVRRNIENDPTDVGGAKMTSVAGVPCGENENEIKIKHHDATMRARWCTCICARHQAVLRRDSVTDDYLDMSLHLTAEEAARIAGALLEVTKLTTQQTS